MVPVAYNASEFLFDPSFDWQTIKNTVYKLLLCEMLSQSIFDFEVGSSNFLHFGPL